ncbi:3-hydroxybutyryl-CoA dehydrogenase, partial [Burkholderia multivorans]
GRSVCVAVLEFSLTDWGHPIFGGWRLRRFWGGGGGWGRTRGRGVYDYA